LTHPLGSAFGGNAAARRRALHFAAAYSAGWLMPMGFEAGDADLAEEIAACNKLRKLNEILRADVTAQVISSAGADIALLRRGQPGKKAIILAANTSTEKTAALDLKLLAEKLRDADVTRLGKPEMLTATLEFSAGGVEMFEALPRRVVKLARSPAADGNAPRIGIEAMTPKVDNGEFPVRRIVGETVTVAADIITDGHDKLAAELLWRPVDEKKFRAAPMTLVNNDRWTGEFTLERLGRYVYAVSAWKDLYASFVDEVTKKHAAGVSTKLELEEGFLLLKQAAERGVHKGALGEIVKQVETASEAEKRDILLSANTVALMRAADAKKFLVQSGEVIVDAERPAAMERSAMSSPACRPSRRWDSMCCISRRSIPLGASTARAAIIR
jgi:starch synthase (maltosyl-transferring)